MALRVFGGTPSAGQYVLHHIVLLYDPDVNGGAVWALRLPGILRRDCRGSGQWVLFRELVHIEEEHHNNRHNEQHTGNDEAAVQRTTGQAHAEGDHGEACHAAGCENDGQRGLRFHEIRPTEQRRTQRNRPVGGAA